MIKVKSINKGSKHKAKFEQKSIVLPAPVCSKSKKTGQKNWAIQLGCFNSKTNADNLLKRIKAKGYPAYLKSNQNNKKETITRVFVGPQEKRFLVERLKQIEKLFNIHGVISKFE